jgi:hypothetical protein
VDTEPHLSGKSLPPIPPAGGVGRNRWYTKCVDTDRSATVDPAASLRAGVHASARGGVQSDGQSVYDELAAILIAEAERREREAKAS